MPDIATCANERCHADFLRLSDGKLFVCPLNRFHFLWLCEICMKRFDVEWQDTTARLIHKRNGRGSAM